MQRYVEQLRRCLLLEASEQPNANASMGVVKLANEIVSLLPCPKRLHAVNHHCPAFLYVSLQRPVA